MRLDDAVKAMEIARLLATLLRGVDHGRSEGPVGDAKQGR
jgi:hypothetical protein